MIGHFSSHPRRTTGFATTVAMLSFCLLGASGPLGPKGNAGAPGQEDAAAHEMLNATLWAQDSGEYEAVTRQIYRLARQSLDSGLVDPSWSAALEQREPFASLPPAILLDLDETLFANARYEARVILELGRYSPASFAAWCNEASAAAVPGAREFLDYAASRGVTIFYTSARPDALRAGTAENLRKLGFPMSEAEGTLLLDDGSSLTERRAKVAEHYRILLIVGDNLRDFVAGSRASPAARRELAERYAQMWGVKWIILPNPMYGHWEASYYDFDYRTPRRQRLERKLSALKP